MTERAATRIKRLPKRECAFYAELCTPVDVSCMVEEGRRCAYFEASVLPLEPELREAYVQIYGKGVKKDV